MSQLTDLFSNIATAIRSKSGDSAQIPAANFASAIAQLPTASYVTQTINATGSNAYVTTLDFPNLAGKKNFVLICGEGFNTTSNPLVSDGSGAASVCVLIDGVCNFAITRNSNVQEHYNWNLNKLAISDSGVISGLSWRFGNWYTAVGW